MGEFNLSWFMNLLGWLSISGLVVYAGLQIALMRLKYKEDKKRNKD